MNIIVVGKKNHIPWVEFVANGFKDNHSKVNIFYINQLSSLSSLKKNIYKYIDKDKSNDLVAKEFEKVIRKVKPDMVFFVSAFFIPIKLYQVAKEYGCYTVAWSGDKFGNNVFRYDQFLDKLYVYETAFIDDAKKLGFNNVELLQKGYDKNIHYDKNLKRRNYANFIGSYSLERDAIFSQATKYNLELHGIKWNQMSKKGKNWIIDNETINAYKVAQIYNETLATLNIMQSVNVYGGVSMRIFEASACGCCVITEPLSDLDTTFEIGKEVLVFNEPDELKLYLNKLDTHSEFFYNIAKNVKAKLLSQEYSYKNRMKYVLDQI